MAYWAAMSMRVILLFLLLVAEAVIGRPAQVILLRHAEKPEEVWDPHLSPRGEERARALVSFFTNTPALTTNGLPVALFAARPKNHGGGVRSEETLAPLAKQLNLPIQTPYPSTDPAALVQTIMNRGAYDGKTVVVCWVHTDLPELAREFGVKFAPVHWKDSVFDRAWIIRFTGKKAKLTEIAQKLLPGDSGK